MAVNQEPIDWMMHHTKEIAEIFLDLAFAEAKALAVHAKIDSSLLAKMPYMENWTKYANQKTQGEA